MACLMTWQRKKFTVAENHEYNETDSINSVQSSFKYKPLLVTLYTYNDKQKKKSRKEFCNF